MIGLQYQQTLSHTLTTTLNTAHMHNALQSIDCKGFFNAFRVKG